MSNISVDLRLRPVRFAFLVKPHDKKRILDIIKINTCLWGGKYNPIIPFFQRVPQWWDRDRRRFENSKHIINGYFDFFEPDFVVEAERGIAKGLGFNTGRVLQLSDILIKNDDRNRKGYGLSVIDLYRELYAKTFQFKTRRDHSIVNVASGVPAYESFCGCLFGSFPNKKQYHYFEQAYQEAFEPKKFQLNAKTIKTLYNQDYVSPLDIGHAKLDIQYNSNSDPVIFIMDASSPRDLIDYWNLRIIQRDIIAVPKQWLSELDSFLSSMINEYHRPLPGNPHGVMMHTTIMFSRSISKDNIDVICDKYFKGLKKEAGLFQAGYPSIWRSVHGSAANPLRSTINADSAQLTIPIDLDNPEINFNLLSPSFAENFGGEHRWANTIQLNAWYNDRIATIFPHNYKDPTFPRFQMGREYLLSTTEGLVVLPTYKNIPENWKLIDGKEAINEWFKDNDIATLQSESGRVTQQIIHTMGGFRGVRSLASSDVVNLLNKMSRQPTLKSMHHAQFKNKIHQAFEDSFLKNRSAQALIERKTVQLGVELKCKKCGSSGWHALDQLDYTLICALCLRQFKFPLINLKAVKWSYRVVGPFALPDFSKGGYASALAIRFFGDVLHGSPGSAITWSAGHELTMSSGDKVEADFILWHQSRYFNRAKQSVDIIFGEAKSFGRREVFDQDDIDQMKKLALQYPGSIIVFATMKKGSDLTKAEIARIKKLAEWGRHYDWERNRTRAPVIVLTGTELFTPHFLKKSWEDMGGDHKKIAIQYSHDLGNIRRFADFTQQLYLNMPSYHKWLDAKWRAKRKRSR